MRRNEPERATLLGNLATLYCHGAAVDWNRLAPDGAVTTLPPRTWQHRRFWRDTAPGGGGGGGQHDVDSHSGLGGRVTVSGATPLEVWRTYLDHDRRPYPGEHSINGVGVVTVEELFRGDLALYARVSLADRDGDGPTT